MRTLSIGRRQNGQVGILQIKVIEPKGIVPVGNVACHHHVDVVWCDLDTSRHFNVRVFHSHVRLDANRNAMVLFAIRGCDDVQVSVAQRELFDSESICPVFDGATQLSVDAFGGNIENAGDGHKSRIDQHVGADFDAEFGIRLLVNGSADRKLGLLQIQVIYAKRIAPVFNASGERCVHGFRSQINGTGDADQSSVGIQVRIDVNAVGISRQFIRAGVEDDLRVFQFQSSDAKRIRPRVQGSCDMNVDS